MSLFSGEGECYDPRDRVYELLSIAQDRRWLLKFPIDYQRPLMNILRDVVVQIGSKSLTENAADLIMNMTR
jgi:hypothetical protein